MLGCVRSAVVLAVLVALGPADAQIAVQPPGGAAPPAEVPWTSVPRRVERREPTTFASPPSDVNPHAAPQGPALAGAAATRGSAVLGPPAGEEATYHRARVIDPGLLEAGETRIRLAGIIPLAVDAQCRGPGAESWPCGRRALAALRDIVRQRPVHCVEAGREGAVVLARCRVGRTDISAWLIERGWARPLGPDARLSCLFEAAREARVGQFLEGDGVRP